MIVLALEGSRQSKNSVQQFINHYNPSYPYVIEDDAIDAIIATGKPQYVPTVKLIAPDRTVIKSTSTDISEIENMLISEGVAKSTCSNNNIITDTTSPSTNAIFSNSWHAEVDNEGAGSKVIKDATIANDEVSTEMFVGNFVYPDGPWTSGKLTGDIGYNISDYDYVKVTYKSSIDLIFELPMPSLNSGGKNFGKRIDASDEYNTLILDLKTFEKPTWAISDQTALDFSKVSTVAFRTLLADGENVEISVKEVIFYKKENTPVNFHPSKDMNSIQIYQKNKNLIINNISEGKYSYRIISLNGKTITKGQLSSLKSKNINNPKLNSGLYFIEFLSTEKKFKFNRSFKWIK